MRIALDIDGVIANFTQAFLDQAVALGYKQYAKDWREVTDWSLGMDKLHLSRIWRSIEHDPLFWLGIPPMDEYPSYYPVGYVTARPVPTLVTKAWLALHQFPYAPIYTVDVRPVGDNDSKIPALDALDAEVFIDDKTENFEEILKAGYNVYLLDRGWNRNCNAGDRRIADINDRRIFGGR